VVSIFRFLVSSLGGCIFVSFLPLFVSSWLVACVRYNRFSVGCNLREKAFMIGLV
jgi:hypothetical protein